MKAIHSTHASARSNRKLGWILFLVFAVLALVSIGYILYRSKGLEG
jgi:hypothetical protein